MATSSVLHRLLLAFLVLVWAGKLFALDDAGQNDQHAKLAQERFGVDKEDDLAGFLKANPETVLDETKSDSACKTYKKKTIEFDITEYTSFLNGKFMGHTEF